MKTNFAKHYKFCLSKKAFILVFSFCTVVLLTAAAFAISQNASAIEESINEALPNFYMQLKVEGPGRIQKDSIDAFGGGKVYVSDRSILNTESGSGTLHYHDSCSAFPNDKAVFDGWYWETGGRITKDESSRDGVPIIAKFSEGWVLTFNNSEHGNLIVKNEKGRLVSDNKLTVPKGATCSWDGFTLKFNSPTGDKDLFGTVEWTADQGYYLAEWTPALPQTITADTTFTPTFKRGYKIDVKWDTSKGDVQHPTGTKSFPFYVEAGTDVDVYNEEGLQALIFYQGIKETEDVYVYETYGDSFFTGWFQGATMMKPGRYPINCDTEITAQIVDSKFSINFNVADGQSSFGHVSSEKFNDVPVGTAYTLDGNTLTLDFKSVPPVTAVVDSPDYDFDYWSIERTILEENGKIYYPLTITAHFIHKDKWRITGNVVKHNADGGEVPVEGANVFYYYEDEEHSTSHLVTSCVSQEEGYFEIFIPKTITKGNLVVAHDTEGTYNQEVLKPEQGNINHQKAVIEIDPDYVYFYGRVYLDATIEVPITKADICLNFDGQPGKFAYAKSNSNGDYILKAPKKAEAGVLVVSAYGYVMNYHFVDKGLLPSISSSRYDAPLTRGFGNTFYQMSSLESFKDYSCDIYINEILRFQDSSITDYFDIAVPENANAQVSFNYQQVAFTYSIEEKPGVTTKISYYIHLNLEPWGIFDHWLFNDKNQITHLPWMDITRDNTYKPASHDGVCINGLIEGERTLPDIYYPVEGADVFFTDTDFNVLDHTFSDQNWVTNYYLRALPQETEGYLLVFKEGYKPFTRFVTAEEATQRQCTINVRLQKNAPGDDSYIYGQVTRLNEKESEPVANADVFYLNEDSSLAGSTLTSSDGYYLFKVPYAEKGTIACLADGYKPYFENLEIKSLLTEKNIVIDKSANNVEATFCYTDKQENYVVEVISKDRTVSCQFVFEDQFSLQFEKDNKYAILENTVGFIYGDYIIRVSVTPKDQYLVKDWSINPVPRTAGTLSIDSFFMPNIVQYCEVDSTWDKNYGNVTLIKSVPYKEIKDSIYVVQDTVLQLESNKLIAQANDKGYFLGWYVNDTLLSNGTYTLSENVTFEARFINRYNTVSFLVADGQSEMGKVEPSTIEATFGSSYNVSGNSITVSGQEAKATSLNEDLYGFDYWTLNGEKVTGSGYVFEPMTFVAHFKELEPWHIKGIVYSGDESTTVQDANVLAYDSTGTTLIDSAVSAKDGTYDLAIPYAIKDIYIIAAHIDYGYNEYDVERPTTDVENLNIILSQEMSFTLLYGNVSKAGSGTSLEGVDVYYVYDNGATPLHTTTDENGNYYLQIDRSEIVGGTVYFFASNFIINSKSYNESYIRDNYFIDSSVELSSSINQTIVWPSDDSCEQINEDVYINKKNVFSEALTKTFSFAVNADATKLKVDSNTLSFKFKALENDDIEYKYSVENKEGFRFSHWLLNGAPVEDGAEIDITKANTLTPVSVAVCEISGTVSDLEEVEGKLPPIKDVDVIFFDDDNRVIASHRTDENGDWTFGDSVIKGTSGNIAFLKKGYKPHLSPVSSSETRQKSMKIFTTLVKSEEADDCYVYGQVTVKTEANADPIPIPNAYIMFYNTEDGTYKECYADDKGTYLLSAKDGESGYLLCMADGYRPSFNKFDFDEYIQVNPFALEKLDTDVNVDFPFAYNQKCYQIEVMDKTTGEVYANFDYFDSLNLNFANPTSYHIGNNHVLIYGSTYNYKFTAIPVENYDFYSWSVYPTPTTEGQLDDDTSFTPNFVYQTSPVILNAGEAVNGFNYKYYIDDTLIWDKDEDYVQDESYVNTVITVNEDGIIESHFNVDLENNEGEVDLWSRVTPQAEDGYVFDSLYVNDKLLEPGDELVVENGNYYFGEINYKFVPQPDPPSPTPDDPEFVNGGQTGDDSLAIVIGLFGIIVLAGTSIFVIRKKQIK